MRSPNKEDIDSEFESFEKLIQVMRDDPLINEKVIQVLQLNSFQRRSVLNSLLEQLRIHHASENLMSALSCLFDDKIAVEVLTLINEVKFKGGDIVM